MPTEWLGNLPAKRLLLWRWGWREVEAEAEISPTVVTVAQAIVDLTNANLAGDPGQLWDRGMGGGALPAVLVTPPIDITALTNGAQIGYVDWHVAFPVAVVVASNSLPIAQGATVEAVEALIEAIDTDTTLNGLVEECRITESAEPTLDDDQPTAPLTTLLRAEARWQERV